MEFNLPMQCMNEKQYLNAMKGQGNHPLLARAVKRASPSGFGLVLTGFGLNGPGQKSPGLNGPKKL